MYKYILELKFRRTLSKLKKKYPKRYKIIRNKISEVITTKDINHYKNLRYPLQKYKRVHINSHFILIFTYNKEKRVIVFHDFNHHDNIYK